MRKRKLLAVILSALCVAAAIPSTPAFADGQKVVTLGADLSEEQKQAILRYFGIAGQNIQTLTITNQDERNHLGSYVPLEQIGTRTYSCALVNPTNMGGIQVKTANLTWVTSNMIATTLSTSGVVNCEVLAAAPFEVSGTGALTGILMAYESAVGTQLDATKKEVATQELITTTTIANNIGQAEATDIVNEAKMQVVQGDVVNENDINVIVNDVAEEENIELSAEDRAMLVELMKQISEQKYNYDDMKETLERVEQNMDALMNQPQTTASTAAGTETSAPAPEVPAASAGEQQQTELPEDSILSGTDDSALGSDVVMDATTPEAVESETPQSEMQSETAAGDIEIFNTDEYTDPAASQTTEEPVTENLNAEQTELPAESGETESVPAEGDNMMPELGDPMFEVPEEPTTDAPAAPILMSIAAEEMKFAPLYDITTAELLPAGINELTISFQREDILAGTGAITIVNASDGSAIETIQANDTEKVTICPLDAEELTALGWTAGCKASILLENPLAPFSFSYVTMTENAFTSADGTMMTAAIEDSGTWPIQTSGFGFCIDKKNLTVGNTAQGQVMMDGTPVTAAYIENADPAMISFDIGEFTASGSFTATLNAPGKTSFQVSFYDAAGTLLNTIPYTVEIK